MDMEEERIREALNAHWRASADGDAIAEHDIYANDSICDYPQSGERILGPSNLQTLRSHHPGSRPVSRSGEFSETPTSGSRNTPSTIRSEQHSP